MGAGLALQQKTQIVVAGAPGWFNSEKLKALTTGATNNFKSVKGRIEFSRDRFLGVKASV